MQIRSYAVLLGLLVALVSAGEEEEPVVRIEVASVSGVSGAKTVREGDHFILQAVITSKPVAYKDVSWTKDGTIVQQNKRTEMHDGTPLNDMSFMQLRVSATDDSKSGTYVCHVTFSPHGRVDSNDLFIEVLPKGASSSEDVNDEEESIIEPKFVTKEQNFEFLAGDDVRLPCEVDNPSIHLVVYWRHNNKIIFFSDKKLSEDDQFSLNGSSLLISNISRRYEGQYSCQNSATQDLILFHNVSVLETPTATAVPAAGFIAARKGDPVTLSCDVTGNPTPQVTWSREGNKKFHDGRKTMMGNSVTFLETTRHHSGVYECLAENSAGTPAKARLHLEITYEPEVEVDETILSMTEGYDVELVCVVHAEPRAHVTWFDNDNKPIEESNRLKQSSSGSRHVLSIDNVSKSDFGVYTCSATNNHGTHSKTIQFTGIPHVPTLIRNKPLTNGIELEWSTFSKTQVTDYRLRYRNLTSEQWSDLNLKSKNVTENKFTYDHVHQVQRLEEGTDYELTIESRNNYGWSQPLTVKFTTLGHEMTKALDSGAGATWCSISTTLVLAVAAILV